MRIGFLQMRPRFGSVEHNVERIESKLERVRDATVVLPELATTGYLFESKREALALAEPANGPSLLRLREVARAQQLTLCVGFAERAGRRVFNSAATITPSGRTYVYRKTHLFDREKLTFDRSPDKRLTTVGTRPRYGIMICFDWVFPEVCRSLALAGARIVLHPSNLVLPYCQAAMVTRAVENRVFTVTCNRVGTESRAGTRLRFTGQSRIVDPGGRVLAQAGVREEALKLVRIDPDLARSKRITARNDLFRDRRTRAYRLQ